MMSPVDEFFAVFIQVLNTVVDTINMILTALGIGPIVEYINPY